MSFFRGFKYNKEREKSTKNTIRTLTLYFKWIFIKYNYGKTYKLHDILSPSRQRTADNLNVIINHWVCREKKLTEQHSNYKEDRIEYNFQYDGLPSAEMLQSINIEIGDEAQVFRAEIDEMENKIVLKDIIEYDREEYDGLRRRLANLASQGRVALGA